MRGRLSTRVCCLDDVEQEASADDELSLDELRLSDRKGFNLAFELDWGQLFASERRRINKGRNRSKGAPIHPSRPNPAAAEPQFPALPSRHATDAGSTAAAASASASSCYACLGCGCAACLSSSPTAWRGAGSTRAALREAVAAMDEGRSELEPRSRVRERQREPRGKRSRAPPRCRPAPQADGASDTLTPAVLSKGAERRLIGKRSHSVAQVRQESVRQARRTVEAAGSWERQPRLVLKKRPQAPAKLAAANSSCLGCGSAGRQFQAISDQPPGVVRRVVYALRAGRHERACQQAAARSPQPAARSPQATSRRCWFKNTGSSRKCSQRAQWVSAGSWGVVCRACEHAPRRVKWLSLVSVTCCGLLLA